MTLIKIKIPGTFEELTVKQFLKLEAGGTDMEILSVLSGESLEEIENTDVDLSPAMARVAELYNSKPPDLTKQKRSKIIIEGKEIKFPSSLDFTRFGQKSMTKNLINDNEKLELIVSEVFAIYAQPLIDGKFISERIPEIKELVDNLPIISVFPYTVFFFKRLRRLKNSLFLR
jgi:hypothetical protein